MLSAVNRLSLVFQRSTIDLTIVSPLLNSTIQTLEKLQQESATEFECKVKELITRTTSEINVFHNAESESSTSNMEDHTSELVRIKPNEPERYEISKIAKNFCQKLSLIFVIDFLRSASWKHSVSLTLLDSLDRMG